METTQYKRQLSQAISPQHEENPDVAKLSTLGMRIRKAVSEGYSVPSNADYNGYNYSNNSYDYNVSQTQPQPIGIFGSSEENVHSRRVPLPDHISQPPTLTNIGSTIDSCSNLSEWEKIYNDRTPALQTLQTLSSNIDNSQKKRKFHDLEETYEFDKSLAHGNSGPAANDSGTDYFQAKYGELKFNEDF